MVNCINLWILVMLHERHNESFRFIKYIGISEILYNRTYTCYTSMCIMYLTLNEEGEGGLVVEFDEGIRKWLYYNCCVFVYIKCAIVIVTMGECVTKQTQRI